MLFMILSYDDYTEKAHSASGERGTSRNWCKKVRDMRRRKLSYVGKTRMQPRPPTRAPWWGQVGPYVASEVASSLATPPACVAFGSRRLTLAHDRGTCHLAVSSVCSLRFGNRRALRRVVVFGVRPPALGLERRFYRKIVRSIGMSRSVSSRGLRPRRRS